MDWLSYMKTNLDAQDPGKCCSDAACLNRQYGLCTSAVVEGNDIKVAAPDSDFALITCPTNVESTCGSDKVIIPERETRGVLKTVEIPAGPTRYDYCAYMITGPAGIQ